ncbi:hypothetical protein ES288_D13G190200v1 [Gossypium darwinii]|uniref:Uncharacterized protein n=1 Tax=Gossypium darwinii TaxID=34276 RepID=A0A5D1ZZL1_GOSDA|nr:hypothetical protein ES288_D13G190200v1 [Gossypium darwinii]
MSSQLLHLNSFWGESVSSRFEWHFTLNHNSSADSSTLVDLDLHLVSPKSGSISSDNFPMKTGFCYHSGGFP